MATDIGGLDPITVSLRDYIDGSREAHELAHERQQDAIRSAADLQQRVSDAIVTGHFKEHDLQHDAVRLAFANYLREYTEYKNTHTATHISEKDSIKTALDAVDRLASLHASAHDKEHHSHEVVHQREREAAGLAREELRDRLEDLDRQRNVIRDAQSNFMPRTEIVALHERNVSAIEQVGKAADNAHTRMDAAIADKFRTVQDQIDKLNIAAASGTGASQRTAYLFGAGLTFITVIIAIVALYLGSV